MNQKTEKMLRSCGAVPITKVKGIPALDTGSCARWRAMRKQAWAPALWYFSAAALRLLQQRAHPDNQRKLSDGYTRRLVKSILGGEWLGEVSPLLFLASCPDKVSDGQHRIKAAIDSGVPGIVFFVMDDLPDEVVDNMAAKKADQVYELVYRQLKKIRGVTVQLGKVKQVIACISLWLNPSNPRRVIREDLTVTYVLRLYKQLWPVVYKHLEEFPLQCCCSKSVVHLPYLLAALRGHIPVQVLQHVRAILIDRADPKGQSEFMLFKRLRDSMDTLYGNTQSPTARSSTPSMQVSRQILCMAFEAFAVLEHKYTGGDRKNDGWAAAGPCEGTAEEVMAWEPVFTVKGQPAAAWCKPV